MNASDGSVSPSDGLKLARARLTSAEASVRAAKKDAKTARTKRKEAKETERLAKKRLRRAKKELREAKRVLASAEESQPRPPRPRRLKPIEPVKVQPPVVAPRRIASAKKKPRKRAVPALKRDRTRRPSAVTPPVETTSEPIIAPPISELPAIAPSEPTPQI